MKEMKEMSDKEKTQSEREKGGVKEAREIGGVEEMSSKKEKELRRYRKTVMSVCMYITCWPDI